MNEKDISQELRLKQVKEINNYFVEEIDKNELLNNGNKKVCKTLNYIEYFFTVAFAVIPCISIYALASLVYISKEITSSSVGLNICAKIATIKKYK